MLTAILPFFLIIMCLLRVVGHVLRNNVLYLNFKCLMLQYMYYNVCKILCIATDNNL